MFPSRIIKKCLGNDMTETKSNKCFLIGGFIFSGNPEAACEGHFFL